MKIFIDASAYLSALMLHDPNHTKTAEILMNLEQTEEDLVTSYGIIGEILTVSSQRYDKQKGIEFVKSILNSPTHILLETPELMKRSFELLQQIKSKNISWVDCYSFAIIETYKIEKVFSFDKDFKRYTNASLLGE